MDRIAAFPTKKRSKFQRIPLAVLAAQTDAQLERNIYVHPNRLARAIFWQRLRVGYELLRRHAPQNASVLDFGGGSGTFLPTLAAQFSKVSVVDLDLGDARRIAAHYCLQNVRLLEQDITKWQPQETFDAVVAMDVLEHFADNSVPLRFLYTHLKSGGLLLTSLPTENLIYVSGRIVLGKTKPADHYYPARELVRVYRTSGFQLIAERYVPRLGPLALPLFRISLFRKK